MLFRLKKITPSDKVEILCLTVLLSWNVLFYRLKTITPSNKVEKLCLMVLLSCFFFQVEDNNTVNVILLNKKFKKSIVLLNSQTEDNNTVKQGRNTLFDGVIVLKCLVLQVEDNKNVKQGRNTLFDSVIVLFFHF